MVYTFHDMLEGCQRRDARAWRVFVAGYLPLARHLLQQYFPSLAGSLEGLLPGLFSGLLDDGGNFFRSFTGRAERELMAHFRRYVLDRARALAALPPPTAAPVSLEVLESALHQFSALQRQAVWLFLLAYAPERLAPILNMKEQTAAEIIQAAQEKLRAAMDRWSEDSLRSSGLALEDAVASRESKDCYPHLTFHRIVDGQITWQEREQVLNHLVACWLCVDRFCVLQEVAYFARKLPAPAEREIEAVLSALDLPPPAKNKSLLARLFR